MDLLHLEVEAYLRDVVKLASSEAKPTELVGGRVLETDGSPVHRGGHLDGVLLAAGVMVGHDGLVVEVLESLELGLDLQASTTGGLDSNHEARIDHELCEKCRGLPLAEIKTT